jgi:hypothetical protein
MSEKPTSSEIVAARSFPPLWLSGMSSSAMT